MKIRVKAFQFAWSGRWYWNVFLPDAMLEIPVELRRIFPQGKVFQYVADLPFPDLLAGQQMPIVKLPEDRKQIGVYTGDWE